MVDYNHLHPIRLHLSSKGNQWLTSTYWGRSKTVDIMKPTLSNEFTSQSKALDWTSESWPGLLTHIRSIKPQSLNSSAAQTPNSHKRAPRLIKKCVWKIRKMQILKLGNTRIISGIPWRILNIPNVKQCQNAHFTCRPWCVYLMMYDSDIH